MSFSRDDLESITQQHIDFQDLVHECNHNELGQCAKLLAMYVAIYKQRFGELPMEKLSGLADTSSVSSELSHIIQDAIEEASAILHLVREEHRQEDATFYYSPAENTIN